MKITRELPGNVNLVRSYTDNQLRIGERIVNHSCLFDAEHLIDTWDVTSVASLSIANLEPAFAWQPEIILLGATVKGFPAREILADITRRGIGFEVMDIGAACRTYNVLVHEHRRAVIGIIF